MPTPKPQLNTRKNRTSPKTLERLGLLPFPSKGNDMTHRTCAHCGESTEHRTARAIYCSKSCSAKASHLRDPSLRQRHQSRYRQSAKGKAAKRRYLKPRTCIGCGETWMTENIRGKYCSQLR